MTNKNNPPAFPVLVNHIDEIEGRSEIQLQNEGMTLLDYFAGQALGSMDTKPDYSKGECNFIVAQRAYAIAKAMLDERTKHL